MFTWFFSNFDNYDCQHFTVDIVDILNAFGRGRRQDCAYREVNFYQLDCQRGTCRHRVSVRRLFVYLSKVGVPLRWLNHVIPFIFSQQRLKLDVQVRITFQQEKPTVSEGCIFPCNIVSGVNSLSLCQPHSGTSFCTSGEKQCIGSRLLLRDFKKSGLRLRLRIPGLPGTMKCT